jgi:hypothetical protein
MRADLRYRELEAKLGPIIMVEHWPEGIFLQWLALLPYANPYLSRESGFPSTFLIFPSCWIYIRAAKT